MSRSLARTAACLPALLLAVAAPSAASAQDRTSAKEECASSAESAQQLRGEGKLSAARDKLLFCARTQCPSFVRADCEKWLAEVDAARPSVVVAARDAQGRDVGGAQLTIDGAPVARGLDGKALDVDPGSHTFTLSANGRTAQQTVLVREGEKSRPVTVVFEERASAGAPAVSAGGGGEAPRAGGGVSPWAWVLAGVGVVGVGVGAALEIGVNSDASGLQSTCGHACSHAQVDPLVLRQQVLGPLAFAVGAAALGVGAYLFFASPAPGGGVAGVAGRF